MDKKTEEVLNLINTTLNVMQGVDLALENALNLQANRLDTVVEIAKTLSSITENLGNSIKLLKAKSDLIEKRMSLLENKAS